MKAITEYTNEEMIVRRSEQNKLFDLIKDVKTIAEKFELYERKSGYAHYTFKVKPSQALLDAIGRAPTKDEIIMIVDSGFSHFGATCSEHNGIYSGRVNTD